jgi:peptide/nickel transport system ATP-binding protein/oligopeptide transport system ATP-binding protein
MTNAAFIRLETLSKQFTVGSATILAVDQVSLDVTRGRTLAVVGESGSGKSTLAHLLLGVERPSSGRILLQQQTLKMPRDRAQRQRFGFVQQNPYTALNARKTVRQAIELPLLVHRIGDRRARRKRVDELLEQTGLPQSLAERLPASLSGGQRQRVVIARALATHPDVLVLDEPTSSLDVSVQARVLLLLQRLQRELGLTYIFITHDLGVVRAMADDIAVMYRGRVVEHATADALFCTPRHPYTNLLLASIPTVSAEDDRIKPDWPWETAMQDARPADTGCAFRLRCPYSQPRCEQETPELTADGQAHWHACFHPLPARGAVMATHC